MYCNLFIFTGVGAQDVTVNGTLQRNVFNGKQAFEFTKKTLVKLSNGTHATDEEVENILQVELICLARYAQNLFATQRQLPLRELLRYLSFFYTSFPFSKLSIFIPRFIIFCDEISVHDLCLSLYSLSVVGPTRTY
tara:strand:+ start:747 stop:1154 length:408 start_codon:yes stop_codon:yes gene_type:complete